MIIVSHGRVVEDFFTRNKINDLGTIIILSADNDTVRSYLARIFLKIETVDIAINIGTKQ